MPHYTVTCARCGKVFTAHRASNCPPPIYCSKECHYDTQSITCPICGKTRKLKKSDLKSAVTCGGKDCRYSLAMRSVINRIESSYGASLRDILEDMYCERKMTFRQMCRELGIANRTMTKLMTQCGIDIRYGSEAVAVQWIDNDERRRLAGERFSKYLSQRVGNKHPNWGGGVSYKYSIPMEEWRSLCDQVRKRDGYRCTRCGMSNAEHFKRYSRRLEVHHIVPFRLSGDNSLDNLTSLCLHCHHVREAEFKWLL